MSKHTTPPAHKSSHINSHTFGWSDNPRGNWNRHKQRRIPSSIRTVGRLARHISRALIQPQPVQPWPAKHGDHLVRIMPLAQARYMELHGKTEDYAPEQAGVLDFPGGAP